MEISGQTYPLMWHLLGLAIEFTNITGSTGKGKYVRATMEVHVCRI